MGGDELWDLGLSDAALIGIFALIVVLTTVGVVVWMIAVPETRPDPTAPGLDETVARDHDQAERIGQELDDETGRSDPWVQRSR